MLNEIIQVQKDKGSRFLSHMEDKYKHKYKYYHISINNMFSKVGLLENTKGGGKEDKNDRE
jgi:hypothetical protein